MIKRTIKIDCPVTHIEARYAGKFSVKVIVDIPEEYGKILLTGVCIVWTQTSSKSRQGMMWTCPVT